MPNTKEEKEKLLLQAFGDVDFQKCLKQARNLIEEELNQFVKYLKKRLKEEQRIYENIESRIKGIDSFREKLYRKDYIKNWTVSDKIQYNKDTISKELPDLIGFRINCFFWQDESVIYEELKRYYQDGKFSNITLDFSEKTKQKNGHTIYKISGKYKNEFSFEVQIKAIMHNIWGEVEHRTIYKNRNYDPDITNKVEITEEIFNILQASDKQLVSLFKKRNDEKSLINALFFEKTKNTVGDKCGTDILAGHYIAFFQLFSDDVSYENIKRYVAYSLLKQEYKKERVDEDRLYSEIVELKGKIEDEFLEYNLMCLYYIYDLLYDINDFEEFKGRLSKYLLQRCAGQDEFADENDFMDDEPFDSTDYSDEDGESKGSYHDDIISFLEDKIGGRKKHD